MFNSSIFERDNFYSLTSSQKWLYVDLCMNCDSDGICASTQRILKLNEADDTDLKELIERGLLLQDSESKAVCIVHWHLHNQIRGDTYHSTDEIRFKEKIYVTDYYELTLDETPYNYAEIYRNGGSIANAIYYLNETDDEYDERMQHYEELNEEREYQETNEKRAELLEQYDTLKAQEKQTS